MNPRLIAKIARWAGGTALAVALAAGAFFVYRQRLASRALRQVPPAVPPSVEQRSLQFTYSKVQGQQTVFTIRASRATEYSGSRNVLEDVDIVIHGLHGERNDQIHTRSCEYDSKSGEIVCHGTVELDLSSVPLGARVPPPAGGIRVETSGVSFNRDSGAVVTDAPVTFRFPGGEGSGEGAEYSSHAADFVLRRNVKIRLAASGPGNVATVVTSPGGLTFDRADNRLRLAGPVEIRQGDRLIHTGKLIVDLNERLRPRRARASGGTLVRVAQSLRRDSLQAAGAEILFDGAGRAEQLNVSGGVVGVEEEPAAIRLQGQRAAITLDPADQQPRLVDVSGTVQLGITGSAGVTRLNSGSLSLTVAPSVDGTQGLRLVKATTSGEAKAEWSSKKDDVQLELEGGRLAVAFGADDQIRDLHGAAGVKVERRQTGQKPIVTTAEELGVDFSRGRWTDAEESGDVRVTQGERSGRADRAHWLRNEGRFELAGGAFVSEPGGETFADTIVWNQNSGQLRASGHVRSSYTKGIGIPGPVNIVATALDANSEKGQAVYSGAARMWAGDQVVQADRIQLDRTKREMIATGNVLAAFPQTPRRIGLAAKSGGVPDVSLAPKTASDKGLDAPVMWRVRAQRLWYVQENVEKPSSKQPASPANEGRMRLDGGVDAWSSQGRMKAKTLVLDFGRGTNGRAELTQATASGGVTVQQGERRGQAANASYDAGTGKFVLWGGKPSLEDTSGDLVTGDRLTFSVANDTILIESSEGSRTLTRHPVPKR